MFTNDIKKGTRIRMKNGWYATVAENRKGNIRDCTVEGTYTETGSTYVKDWACLVNEDGSDGEAIELTYLQHKHAKAIAGMGF